MTTDASKKEYMDVNTPLVITIGIVSAILVFGVTVPGIKALTYNVQNRFIRESYVTQPNDQLIAHRLDELKKISTYRWIDKDKAIAAIPIEDAMKLYAQRNSQQ